MCFEAYYSQDFLTNQPKNSYRPLQDCDRDFDALVVVLFSLLYIRELVAFGFPTVLLFRCAVVFLDGLLELLEYFTVLLLELRTCALLVFLVARGLASA